MERLKDLDCTRSQPILSGIFNLSVGLIENGKSEVRIDNIRDRAYEKGP